MDLAWRKSYRLERDAEEYHEIPAAGLIRRRIVKDVVPPPGQSSVVIAGRAHPAEGHCAVEELDVGRSTGFQGDGVGVLARPQCCLPEPRRKQCPSTRMKANHIRPYDTGAMQTLLPSMPDWGRIDTVLLDMDGTILDLKFDNTFWREIVPARFAAAQGLELDAAKAQLQPVFAAKQGTLEWYCIEYWSRELELDLEQLKREAREQITWLPQAESFVRASRVGQAPRARDQRPHDHACDQG